MADNDRPTLLVFTLGPGREQARKRWLARGFERLERDVHRRCLERALEAGREAGCRLRVCSPGESSLAPDAVADRQSGTGFGRRLLGAVARAEAESSGPLIVVGTDTPRLDRATLTQTLKALATDPDEVVLGPASDGGVYLLASARPLRGLLGAVRWCRRDTLESLLAALRAAGRPVRLLPVMSDLDSRRDLERWVADERSGSGEWARLLGALRSALAQLAAMPTEASGIALLPAWSRVPVGRAPPH